MPTKDRSTLFRGSRGSPIGTRNLAAAIFAAFILLALAAFQGFSNEPVPGDRDNDVEALIRAGHWKRARAIVEPRVQAHPQDAKSCYELAEVKFTFKDIDGALPLAQHAVELDPNNSNYHLQLGKVYGEQAARASFISAGSLAVKFRKEVEVAIQLDSKNLDVLDAMMQFKFQAPGIMGGSKDEARELADKIAALNPSAGYLAHAELAELEKDPAQMEAFYLKAVQADAGNYDAVIALATFYSQSPHAKYDEAMKQSQSAMHLDPRRIGAYRVQARVFALQQRWADLEQTLASAEKNVPDDLRPYYEAAQGLLESGRGYAKAEGYVKKYLSQEPEGEEPDSADAHRLLGLLFERERRNAEARSEFHAALKLRRGFKAAKEDLKNLND